MTPEVHKKRIDAVKFSRAVNALEGVPLSSCALTLKTNGQMAK